MTNISFTGYFTRSKKKTDDDSFNIEFKMTMINGAFWTNVEVILCIKAYDHDFPLFSRFGCGKWEYVQRIESLKNVVLKIRFDSLLNSDTSWIEGTLEFTTD